MRDFVSEKARRIKPSGIRKFFDIVAKSSDVISLGIEAVDKQDGWYDMTEARISRLIDTVLDAIMLRYKAL